MSSETSITLKRRSLWRRVDAWARRVKLERKAALALAVAAIGSGLVTYVTVTESPPSGLEPGTELALIILNLVLLLIFGAVVAKRLVEIWAQRRRGLAGSRLHIRLVVLFSAVAVTPTIIVAIFSYLFLSIGMDSWFSDKVRTALAESRSVAQAYLEEHQENIRSDALGLASDLNSFVLHPVTPAQLSDFIESELETRSMTEAIVFDPETRTIYGRSALSFSIEFEPVPDWALKKAEEGEVAIVTSANEDRVRALIKLNEFRWGHHLMLYVGRPIAPQVLSHVKDNNEAVDQYELREGQRSAFQITSVLIFGAFALLLLLAAVWVGLNFATQISRRISGLVVAAERVRSGDLSARVLEVDENDEFGSLSRAFNRMTGQLESQQSELVEANRQLDLRRQFTEAVLSGVSAGVIGLDEQGFIHLPNRSASTLLSIELEQHLGQPLAVIVPEMAPLLDEVFQSPERLVEGQIRLMAAGRAMVLLVRIASERGQGETRGFVVTFDDITELLSAQRKAAWADVARRIAHEMKNPLTPIQLSAERLKRKYLREIQTDPETFAICTDTIIRQVGDIGRMVDEFSSFARMPAPTMKQENLLEITRQAVFLQRTAHSEIDFVLDVPAEPVEITCDSRQISQALINLLQNAIDSIHARQVAQASAGGGTPDPGRIHITLQSRGNRTVLAVLDNGKGLPKEGRENLTEPYVTTRTKGTGLGLAIVKKIMEDHAGELLLQDGPEGGASVALVFIGRGTQPPKRRVGAAQDEVRLQTEVATHGA
ncbi:MAG TPA: PAS domain-containing sensor histidine kinase [Aliidongia sp.]|nr:PAS domain-containing sensor histidine kinase [Aliidongia sp.]